MQQDAFLFLEPSHKPPLFFPECPGLHQLVEAQVERTPDAISLLVEPETQWSYHWLDTQGNQLAHCLQQAGIDCEVSVGICLPRGVDLVISVLAVLKCGAVYVPLDPEYPSERLHYMLNDAHISVIITETTLLSLLPSLKDTQIICLDEERQSIRQQSEEPLNVPIHPAMLAYCIYTSGSTGRPKGTLNTHQGISNRLLWAQASSPLSRNDCFLLEVSPSFDIFLWELFWPLLAGAKIVLVRPGGQRESYYLAHLIRQEAVSVAHASPSLLRELLREDDIAMGHHLTRMYCGGEVLPPDLQKLFFQRLPAASLYNQYGPTECAAHSTSWQCRPECEEARVPVGTPIANVSIHVLDPQGNPVPGGETGEFAIGGVGVGRGYMNQPDLTADRYIPDSWSLQPGGRLYLTGDIGRCREDGVLEFLYRSDEQVKLRGYRVELGEIEAVLRQHKEIRDAIVVIQNKAGGDQRLIAYVVLQTEPGPGSQELRVHAQLFLPDYMLPNLWVALPALPRSPNGKVDRQALPLPDDTRSELNSLYVAPRTATEQTLAEMWQQLLDVQQVGVYDDFFVLGGHSLKATQVVSRTRRAFQVQLSLLDFFLEPTIAALARLIEKARGND